MAERKPISLTNDERRAANLDDRLADAVRRFNWPAPPSILDLFPNAIPVTDLDVAASCGQMHRVKIALNAGADVNELGPFGTALHGAAENGHLEIVRLLLEHGADVGILDPIGRTAQAAALKAGHSAVEEYLRNVEDKQGDSPRAHRAP